MHSRHKLMYWCLSLILPVVCWLSTGADAFRFRRAIDENSCWPDEVFVRCGVERRCEPSCTNGAYLPKDCPLDMHTPQLNRNSPGAMITCTFPRCVCKPGHIRAYDWACMPAAYSKCVDDDGNVTPFVWPPQHIGEDRYEYLRQKQLEAEARASGQYQQLKQQQLQQQQKQQHQQQQQQQQAEQQQQQYQQKQQQRLPTTSWKQSSDGSTASGVSSTRSTANYWTKSSTASYENGQISEGNEGGLGDVAEQKAVVESAALRYVVREMVLVVGVLMGAVRWLL